MFPGVRQGRRAQGMVSGLPTHCSLGRCGGIPTGLRCECYRRAERRVPRGSVSGAVVSSAANWPPDCGLDSTPVGQG